MSKKYHKKNSRQVYSHIKKMVLLIELVFKIGVKIATKCDLQENENLVTLPSSW